MRRMEMCPSFLFGCDICSSKCVNGNTKSRKRHNKIYIYIFFFCNIYFERHSTDFTHVGQFPRHEECARLHEVFSCFIYLVMSLGLSQTWLQFFLILSFLYITCITQPEVWRSCIVGNVRSSFFCKLHPHQGLKLRIVSASAALMILSSQLYGSPTMQYDVPEKKQLRHKKKKKKK